MYSQKITDKPRQRGSFISNTFKLWLVGIIFFLTFFHIYTLYVYPRTIIVSDQIILGVLLALVGYLWMQELRDRDRLESINRSLIEAQRRLEHAEINAIAALVLAEEAKDFYTRGHSKRVTDYSVYIASELGLSEEKKKIIERAGILHDIGKIGIDDSILKKPGKLTDEEWFVMCGHPQRAAEIISPLEFLKEEKDIILHHHERYDGKGYPGGLKAEEAPLGARIVAVADTFDAMNSERPYRKPLSPEAVIEELKKVAGSQLDPNIVNVFVKLLEKRPLLWERG